MHLQIVVTDINPDNGEIYISGKTFTQGVPAQGAIPWVVKVNWDSNVTQINAAIEAAAVAAVEAAGYSISVEDKKIIYGSANS